MNVKNILLFFALFAGVFVSCSEDGIPVFADEASLNFPKTNFMGSKFKYDSLVFSSVFHSGGDEAVYRIPVYLTGRLSDKDRKYQVSVNPGETRGVVQGTHFSIDSEQLFKAGRYLDSLTLTLNVAKIKEDKIQGRIYLNLVPNENFTVGLSVYQNIVLSISGTGLSAQPAFWNSNSLGDYGGAYSHIKAEKFIELNGIPDAAWRAANKSILYAYAKKTYEWFEANEVYDNGERVVFKGSIIF